MKDLTFASPLADHFGAYIKLRRNLGFELRSQVNILQKFDRVLQKEMSNSGPVTATIIESFLRSLEGLQPLTRRHQLSTCIFSHIMSFTTPYGKKTRRHLMGKSHGNGLKKAHDHLVNPQILT